MTLVLLRHVRLISVHALRLWGNGAYRHQSAAYRTPRHQKIGTALFSRPYSSACTLNEPVRDAVEAFVSYSVVAVIAVVIVSRHAAQVNILLLGREIIVDWGMCYIINLCLRPFWRQNCTSRALGLTLSIARA